MKIAEIRIYPVKALRGGSHEAAFVEPWGLAGDRRWMVVDRNNRFLTQREHHHMALIRAEMTSGGVRITAGSRTIEVAEPGEEAPVSVVAVWRDQFLARTASDEAASFLSDAVGIECHLVWMHDPRARRTDPAFAPADSTVNFADGFPVLLGSLSSVEDLNRRLPSPITIGRFRPNLIVESASPWEEDGWRRVCAGDVEFAVVKPCDRCMVTTIDPDTGERADKTEPLRTLAQFRRDVSGGVMFGQNLVPLTSGTVRAGDELVVLERGEPNVQLTVAT